LLLGRDLGLLCGLLLEAPLAPFVRPLLRLGLLCCGLGLLSGRNLGLLLGRGLLLVSALLSGRLLLLSGRLRLRLALCSLLGCCLPLRSRALPSILLGLLGGRVRLLCRLLLWRGWLLLRGLLGLSVALAVPTGGTVLALALLALALASSPAAATGTLRARPLGLLSVPSAFTVGVRHTGRDECGQCG
jgi:hypothetical protein